MTTLNTIAQFRPVTSIEPASTTTSNISRPESLSRIVRHAVRSVDDVTLVRVARCDAGIAFEPRTLLAVMTYCYANEIYGSADIEDVMRRDVAYRQLCQNEFPGARVFRRFRRENRAVLQSCLERVLQAASGAALAPGLAGKSEDQLAVEASRRMGIAMFMDSMEDWQ